MATTEEKQETIDRLKGPRFYRVYLNGYGGEATYINLSKKAYDFWNDIVEENGDSDLVEYMINAEDGDFDFEDIDSVPKEADFMTEGDYTYPWYEPPNEFSHQHGVPIDGAWLNVQEVSSDDYMAAEIGDPIIDGIDTLEYLNNIEEDNDFEIELTVPDDNPEDTGGDYVLQLYSSEKGCFFDGVIETVGDFDPKKLKVHYTEFPNGEDIVTSIEYDGVEIDNNGGDTNGKGYSAHLWSNV